MRFVDKTVSIWKFCLVVQVVDLFERRLDGGSIYPLISIDLMKTPSSIGVSLTIPFAKITIAVKLKGVYGNGITK